MKRVSWERAQAIAEEFAANAAPDTAQFELLVLAERALTESAKWSSYMRPNGQRHFDNVSGPLSDGLAFLVGAIRAEAAGNPMLENRLWAAQRLFAAGWSLMVDGHDIEAFRQAAVADMPALPDEGEA